MSRKEKKTIQIKKELFSPIFLKKIFSQILNYVTSNEPDLRKTALLTISRLKGESAAQVIFERYESDNLEDYLALVVNEINPEISSKFLIAALSDPNPEARLMAAGALASEKREASVLVLTDIIEGHLSGSKMSSSNQTILSHEALILAIRALGEIGTPFCVSLLKKFITQETNSKIKASAIAAISKHMNDQMIPMLQPFLSDTDSRVRANSVEALENLNNLSVVGILQPFLFDTNQRVKANVAKAIWKYGDYEVSATLKEMLGHTVKAQRVSGIYAVGEIHPQAFARQLLAFLPDPDADIRRHAVIAIKKMGPSEHALKLIPMLSDRDPEVRKEVAKALVEIYGDGALGALVKHLTSETSNEVKSLLISQIGELGKENALPQLAPFLESSVETIILATIKAIGSIRPQNPPLSIVSAVKKLLLTNSQDKIRAAALNVLWHWECKEALEVVTDFLLSGSKEKAIHGLKSMGEIFEAVSSQEAEIQELFEKSLKEAVEMKKRSIEGAQNQILQNQVSEKMNQAQAFIQFNQLEDAEKLLKEILSQNAQHLSAIVALGDILFKTNRITEAAELFESALVIQPNHVKAHYSLGQIYTRLGLWNKASASLFAVIQLHPKLPQAFLLLSDSLENEGKISQSVEILKKLQALVPKNERVMSKLARALFLDRKFGEGIPWARQAATLGARDLPVLLIQAIGEINSSNYPDGIKRLLRLIRIILENPDNQSVNELRKLAGIAEEIVLGILKNR
ncbi:MAG: HEAT repeat domain-containing protein [Candidatus Riflebacteria bacterium]|nr:HEAT repeat domain-containing protein [Candidatus Riflebacteria bacterium]